MSRGASNASASASSIRSITNTSTNNRGVTPANTHGSPRQSTTSGQYSYAYGAPPLPHPSPNSRYLSHARSGFNFHTNNDDALSILSGGSTDFSTSTLARGESTGRAPEPAFVRYGRVKQRQRDTGNTFLPPPASINGTNKAAGTIRTTVTTTKTVGPATMVKNWSGQDTSVNVAVAFGEVMRGHGELLKPSAIRRDQLEREVEDEEEEQETVEVEEDEEEEEEGGKEPQMESGNGEGLSRKRKKRVKDPSFKPIAGEEDESDTSASEDTPRGGSKAKRARKSASQELHGSDEEQEGEDVDATLSGSREASASPRQTKSTRRKSKDKTYRPAANEEAESSEPFTDDDTSRRRKKGKGRASAAGAGGGGAASMAIPIGVRDSNIWMGKKRKGKKGRRSAGGSEEGEGEEEVDEEEEEGNGSGEGVSGADDQDQGGEDTPYFEPPAPQSSTSTITAGGQSQATATSFYLRPRSPSLDPHFAEFDRSINRSVGASSAGDDSILRGSSYDYSEEERIVAALEAQKKRDSAAGKNGAFGSALSNGGEQSTPTPKSGSGSGSNGAKRNRLPGPPVRQPFLGGIAEEDVAAEGDGAFGRAMGKLLRPIWAGIVRLWKELQNPLLDWGKILRVGGAGLGFLMVMLAIILSNPIEEATPPPSQIGSGLFSFLPFFRSSTPFTSPSAPVDSFDELVTRLNVLENAMNQLSALSESERKLNSNERRLVGRLSDQVINLESTVESEIRKVTEGVKDSAKQQSRESQDIARDVVEVKADLSALVARVKALDDRKANAADLHELESGVSNLGRDIASLGTKVARVAQDVQSGVDAERIAKIALDAIEARLPQKLAVQFGPSGKLEVDPAFWKYLREAFVDRSEVDRLVTGEVASAVARAAPRKGESLPPPLPPVVKAPSWQEFLDANEVALRSWVSSDITARAGSDAIVTKRMFLDLLHREIKTLKVDFEAKSNENVQKIGQELLQKVAKQEQMRRDAETKSAGSVGERVTVKTPDGSDVSAIINSLVDSALVKYSKDVLGRPDYALATAGGRVIPSLTSATYEVKASGLLPRTLGWFTGSGTTTGRPPVTALLPQNSLGWCWPFAGSQGQLGLLLSRRVVPTDVTIEHASVDIALDGDVKSAPKDFEVWGVVEDREDIKRLADYRTQQLSLQKKEYVTGAEMDDDEVSPSVPSSPNHMLLAAGSYDIAASSPIQTFPVTASVRQLGIPVSVVVVKFLSNHGDSHYTCIYRVRISGASTASL